jgi:hypothetical protein
MKTKALLASLAVFSLAVAHPAAAATRSYETLPIVGVQASGHLERAGVAIDENEDVRGRRSIWLVFVALGLAALAVMLLTNGENNSPVSP